jgi:hypothetical protein
VAEEILVWMLGRGRLDDHVFSRRTRDELFWGKGRDHADMQRAEAEAIK